MEQIIQNPYLSESEIKQKKRVNPKFAEEMKKLELRLIALWLKPQIENSKIFEKITIQ